jgi:bacillolysin
MKKKLLFPSILLLGLLMVLVLNVPGHSQPVPPTSLDQLRDDANGEVEIIWNSRTNTPSFIRGSFPVTQLLSVNASDESLAALMFIEQYLDIFGVSDTSQELIITESYTDEIGMRHVAFQQVYQGIEVFGARMKIHLNPENRDVVAASSGFIPNLSVGSVTPKLSVEEVLPVVYNALPNGMLFSEPRLVVYVNVSSIGLADSAKLAWLVELSDNSIPARNVYIIDAESGNILDVFNRITTGSYDTSTWRSGSSQANLVYDIDQPPNPNSFIDWSIGQGLSQQDTGPVNMGILQDIGLNEVNGRNRVTYDAEHRYSLPGTLVRLEGDGPTGDEDVDNAHDFAGATDNYFWQTHGRNSYDNKGVPIVSTANFGVSYMNAHWNGEQVYYGDHLPVKDVVAHEITHAVIEHSANLEYRWQSGALNESYADIFAAMVDRNNWLIGEDLPFSILLGQEAMRDMAEPTRFGQPDHTDDWLKTCSDEEGVHTNSGIVNKAYYNIATEIGKEKAEQIFYRALTVYLDVYSSLEDARAAALQSAADFYGNDGDEYNAVRDGFNAVGLDGTWNPGTNNCTCAATTAISASNENTDRLSTLKMASTLYRVRDQLLIGEAGEHYQTLYEQHTGRINYLLIKNNELLTTGGKLLKQFTPGLNNLMTGVGDNDIITRDLVDEVIAFLEQLSDEDRDSGDGELADTIEREMDRINWDHLVGKSYDEAWEYIQSVTNINFMFLPLIQK